MLWEKEKHAKRLREVEADKQDEHDAADALSSEMTRRL